MSVSDASTIDGHLCDAPVQLLVGDETPVGIPIVGDGCRLYERKQGPMSISRRAEVEIPIEYDGRVWTDAIDAFQPDGSIQPAEVRYAPIDSDGNTIRERQPVFRGYIGGVGSSAGRNRARVSIFDPMKFLSSIEAGVTFAEGATVRSVLEFVRDRFVDQNPVFDNLLITAPDSASDGATAPPIIGDEAYGLASDTSLRPAQFSSNRDTLADVVSYVLKDTSFHVDFRPTTAGYGLSLVVSQPSSSTDVDLTPDSDGPPFVFANNSLAEMRPFNAITLKGDKGFNLTGFDQRIRTPFFDDQYPEVTAYYPPLVERFGKRLSKIETAPMNNGQRLQQAAISRLKQMLDEVSGGTLLTTLAPQLHPFDTVLATPACSGVAADVDPIRYEVQRTVHKLTPDPSDNGVTPLPRTELAVSLAIDETKIEAEDPTSKTAQPSRKGDNEPDDDPNPYVWTTSF